MVLGAIDYGESYGAGEGKMEKFKGCAKMYDCGERESRRKKFAPKMAVIREKNAVARFAGRENPRIQAVKPEEKFDESRKPREKRPFLAR